MWGFWNSFRNMPNIILPNIDNKSMCLEEITSCLGVHRNIIASADEISEAWNRLPRILSNIPPELRTKWIVKMCIAVSSWLFDSWISYVWNESITELRNKIKRFWLSIVWEITEKRDFDENKLNDLQDSELLDLCLKLNLITEEGFFYLDQCRNIRNNFSAAHPTIWKVDEPELISFTNRCIKYSLSNEINSIGVNISEFILSIKYAKFNSDQLKIWCDRLESTYEAQRELLFGTLYWICCDPDSTEETRVNSLNIFVTLKALITPTIKRNLISSHQNYILKWATGSTAASEQFFEKIWMLELLWEREQHAIIDKACQNLMTVHGQRDNFHNEPPFAARLLEIITGTSVPDTIKESYVQTVLSCWIGNGFWVSRDAFPYYQKMVSNFSPKEIWIMFNLIEDNDGHIWNMLSWWWNRSSFLKTLILGIDISSIPVNFKRIYQKWTF